MSLKGSIEHIKTRVGPLGWGALLVFVLLRIGDLPALVSKLLLGRWLPLIDFGVIDPVFSVLAILSLPITIVYQIGVKSISRLQAKGELAQRTAVIRDLMKIAAVGSGLSVVVIFLLKGLILSRLHLDGGVYVALMGVMFVAAWWTPLLGAVLQGTQRYHLLAVPVVAGPFLVLLLTIVFVGFMQLQLKGALLARACSVVVSSFALLLVLRSTFSGRRDRYGDEFEFMKAMFLPMAGYLVSLTVLLHFDRLFVRNFLLNDSGGYGAIVTLGQVPLWFISPVFFVLFPLASAAHAVGRGVAAFRRQATLAGAAVTLICAVIFFFLAEPLFRIWQPAFAPYGRFVWLYAVAMGMHALIEILARAEMARHRYAFLWFVVVPTALMCWLMRSAGSTIGFETVLIVTIATRAVILLGIWLAGSAAARREQSSVRSKQ